MKPIATNTQKKLVFVPMVNIFTIFIVLYNCLCMHTAMKTWIKIYPYLFGYTVPSVAFWAIVAQVFPALAVIWTAATMYFTPMLMSYGLIRFQRKYLGI